MLDTRHLLNMLLVDHLTMSTSQKPKKKKIWLWAAHISSPSFHRKRQCRTFVMTAKLEFHEWKAFPSNPFLTSFLLKTIFLAWSVYITIHMNIWGSNHQHESRFVLFMSCAVYSKGSWRLVLWQETLPEDRLPISLQSHLPQPGLWSPRTPKFIVSSAN